MTQKEFYGEQLKRLVVIQEYMQKQFLKLADAFPDYSLYFSSRIKSASSMKKKLQRRGVPVNADSAIHVVNDALGFRIVCRWTNDIPRIADWIKKHPKLVVHKVKDYVSFPKPNGYRSYHLIVSHVKEPDIAFEIQIRTVAMDLWSNIEHDTQYKKPDGKKNKKLSKILRQCAENIAALDCSLQKIQKFKKIQN